VRKLLVAITGLALVVGLAGPAAAAKKQLRVTTSLPAPGFWQGDTIDEIDGGFEYELALAIADKLGYDGVKLKNVSFDALVAGRAKGFDFALSQVSITNERKKVVDFSVPYYRSDNGIMVNKGTEVPDAETARGLRWGVQTGTTQIDFLNKKLKVDQPPRTYQETTQMFAALQANQVDAVMTDNDMMFTMRYAFYSDRLTRFEQALKSAGIEHRLIRPRSPESNGKVERFIKTIDDECYRIVQPRTSRARVGALRLFLDYYNHSRPHQSLGGESPVTRRDAYFAQARA